jgi:hypothetical protein
MLENIPTRFASIQHGFSALKGDFATAQKSKPDIDPRMLSLQSRDQNELANEE